MAAGTTLKTLRNRCNITVRQVEQASVRIAEAKGDKRFRISNGWLAQLENGISEPSICKLFTLSVIYHAHFHDLARLYNVDIDEIQKYESIANPDVTQLRPDRSINEPYTVTRTATGLVPQLTSSNTPEAKEPSNIRHGYVGLTDYMMYPLIRPGALVEIDTDQNSVRDAASWHNQFDRPIFFIELHEGYACGWCELQGNQLLILPHHSSPSTVRHFIYPREAEIFGRVVGYTTRCVDNELLARASDSKQRTRSSGR